MPIEEGTAEPDEGNHDQKEYSRTEIIVIIFEVRCSKIYEQRSDNSRLISKEVIYGAKNVRFYILKNLLLKVSVIDFMRGFLVLMAFCSFQ